MRYEVGYVKNWEEFREKLNFLPKAQIDKYPWNCAYQPETYAQLAWNEDGLFVYMRSYETEIRAVETGDNGDIYMDSCLEFFINPCPDEVFFCNFEVNPRGAMYLASGLEDRDARVLQSRSEYGGFDLPLCDPSKFNGKGYWDVCYRVPTAYFKQFNPDFVLSEGTALRANFYKCGDGTKVPHYGCWSPITSGEEIPNFYHVCDFGEIILKSGK